MEESMSSAPRAAVLASFLAVASPASGRPSPEGAGPRGILLEQLTWAEAEPVLKPDTVVVIPLGAQAKEHGLHLRLDADWVQAEYFKKRILERSNVVVAPTVNYSYYPAFVEYPGSTTLELETSRDVIVQICRTLSAFGPRRFYVINIGVSTVRALQPAVEMLAGEGIALRFTDLLKITGPIAKRIARQEGGTHADEIETSIVFFIEPRAVRMDLARKDYEPRKGVRLTRLRDSPNTYSPTGVWGDATLATPKKGEELVRGMLDGMLAEIEALRATPLPAPRSPASE
jgi:creatinine amidohydrolase